MATLEIAGMVFEGSDALGVILLGCFGFFGLCTIPAFLPVKGRK